MTPKEKKIIACIPLSNYCVRIKFEDELEGTVDLSDLLKKL